MTEPLRNQPGPRDWALKSPSPQSTFTPGPPWQPRARGRMLGLGVATLLLGAASLAALLKPELFGNQAALVNMALALAALATGGIALSRLVALRTLDRITAVMGFALANLTLAAWFAASTGLSTGFFQYGAPVAFEAPSEVASNADYQQERMELVEAVRSASLSVKESMEADPSLTYATALEIHGSFLTTALGSSFAPLGTHFYFQPLPDNKGYVLTGLAPSGAAVTFDSERGVVFDGVWDIG